MWPSQLLYALRVFSSIHSTVRAGISSIHIPQSTSSFICHRGSLSRFLFSSAFNLALFLFAGFFFGDLIWPLFFSRASELTCGPVFEILVDSVVTFSGGEGRDGHQARLFAGWDLHREVEVEVHRHKVNLLLS